MVTLNMMNVSMYGPNHDHHHSAAGYLPTPANHHHQLGTSSYANFSSHLHHSHHHHNHHFPHINSSHFDLPEQTSSTSLPNAITPPASHTSNHPPTIPPSTTSTSAATNVHQIYHPHLYSPTAVEYGITTTNATPPDDIYYDAEQPSTTGLSTFYHQQNNGSGCATPAMIHDHIINTDNGLSYTNLDYMNYSSGGTSGGYLSTGDDKMSIPNPYGHHSSSESSHPYSHHHHQHHLHHHHATHQPHHSALIHHQSNIPSSPATTWHMSQPVADYLDTNNQAQHLGLGGAMHSETNSQQHHQMRSGNASSRSQVQGQSHPHQSSIHQQSHHAQAPPSPVDLQPTYKWMQVKRNVPKAHSECIYHFVNLKCCASFTRSHPTTAYS